MPARRETGNRNCVEGKVASPRQRPSPAIAPSAIAAICPNEPPTMTTTNIAASAIIARARSGVSVRVMPQTACATTATATSLRPCRKSFGDRPGKSRRAKRKGEQDQGGRHGETEPRREAAAKAIAAQNSEREPDLTRGGAGQELTEGNQIDVARFVDPLAPQHQLVTKIAEMRDRATKRRETEFQKGRNTSAGEPCCVASAPS